jgi:hypothetical protein
MKDTILHFLHVSAHLTQNSIRKRFYLRSIYPVDQVPQTLDWRNKNTKISHQSLKAGLHYQSFCDHSRNFAAQVNSKFWRICKKCLRKPIQCLFQIYARKTSRTLNEWRFNLSFSWVLMLFLNSWRASVIPYYVTTHPPAIQKQHWHSREAQIEPPLIECEWAFRIRAMESVPSNISYKFCKTYLYKIPTVII